MSDCGRPARVSCRGVRRWLFSAAGWGTPVRRRVGTLTSPVLLRPSRFVWLATVLQVRRLAEGECRDWPSTTAR